MKKNKLIVSMVVVLLIALMVPMFVMANPANSPQITGASSFSIGGLSATQEFSATHITGAQEQAFNVAASGIGANTYLRGVYDLKIWDSATNSFVQPPAGQQVRVDVPGVVPGDRVDVFHLKSNGQMEQISGVSVYNGYIMFTPNGFSLYGVYVGKAAPASTTTTTTTTTSSAVLSPQTGVYA